MLGNFIPFICDVSADSGSAYSSLISRREADKTTHSAKVSNDVAIWPIQCVEEQPIVVKAKYIVRPI